MANGSIFSHCIKIIFLTLGIYLIVINLAQLTLGKAVYDFANENWWTYNFTGWHQYKYITSHGFSWFFQKLEDFPLFDNLYATFQSVKNLTMSLDGTFWGTLNYIANIIVTPFKFIWAIFTDIINTFAWMVGFFLHLDI